MALVETTLEALVGTLTLAHDTRRNALGRALVDELLAAPDRFRAERARLGARSRRFGEA